MTKVPTFDELMNPLLSALSQLGGSGSIEEINAKVLQDLKLPEDVLTTQHDPEASNQTEVEYRLAWARTYLKRVGVLDNSSRGVWSLKNKDGPTQINARDVVKQVRDMVRKEKAARQNQAVVAPGVPEEDQPEEAQTWRTQLHFVLTKTIEPASFERLVQRVLRESGFIQVEVTGRTGDGGIDGKGIARIHGFMSFHVVFQCKRYQGVVSAGEVRDFRGAMVGRADKGLFITTGSFSRDAVKEATRDGAPPIDLVDGDQLADKLKELGLGVSTEKIERVSVDEDWFKTV